ncbi:hypothetical protein niasHT_037338 [Heterodera trifolii]|uniref:Uncharacterized protein n=1 Tax=Heterodera trifolii TaxID=157864 RepID=A0ABD2J0F2_9BILA
MGAPTAYDICLAACGNSEFLCMSACWAGLKAEVGAGCLLELALQYLGRSAYSVSLSAVPSSFSSMGSLHVRACIGAVQPPPVWACNQGGLHAPSDQQNCDGEELFGVGSNV